MQWLDGDELRSGVIDRLVDDGTQLWILDYKTAAQPQAEPLMARYRPQLLAYVDAVRRLWPGRPVRAGLVLTATAEWLPLTDVAPAAEPARDVDGLSPVP